MLIASVFAAARQVLSPPMRRILLKSLALTAALLALVWLGLSTLFRQVLAGHPLSVDYPILDGFAFFLAGAGLFIALAYILPAVAALVAGYFADDAAEIIERTDFPSDPPGQALSLGRAMIYGLRFAGLSLLVNIAALILCTAGVALIGVNSGGDADVAGILLVLGAAFSWAIGNVVAKRAGAIDMLALVAWSNLFAVPPLIAAALLFEGPAAVQASIAGASLGAWATVLWQAFGNALFGYAAWNWLLARHPAADVAPMGLLVPVLGMSAAAWLLAEPMPLWKLVATALVLVGLAVNMATSRRAARLPAA